MKVIILLLIVILIFFGCATLGYQIANVQDASMGKAAATDSDGMRSEQHNLILLRVDRLNDEQPRLISVWFVSLFFVNDIPSTLTLAEIYPPKTPTGASRSLERSFALSSNGDPAPGFWNTLEVYKIQWESFVMIDTVGAEELLEWLIGPGDYQSVLQAAEVDQRESQRLVEQICGSIVSAKSRDIGLFNWTTLAPQHFRSSLRMETGLSYWSRMTSAEKPVRCEILMAP
jgi:hypothetical protein